MSIVIALSMSGAFGSVLVPTKFAGISHKADAAFEEMWQGAPNETSVRDLMNGINVRVNTRITYVEDRIDQWAVPSVTRATKQGDCEDIALLKMKLLGELGVPLDNMSIVVVQDIASGKYHAVLAVAVENNMFILDSKTNRVTRDIEVKRYKPLYSLTTHGAFINGVRKSPLT